MIHKFLRLFVNTFTVNEKHYQLNRDNLTEAIQMHFSKKEKTFSEFFFPFRDSLLNFKYLPTKDDPHR